jgi:hypothetical protein
MKYFKLFTHSARNRLLLHDDRFAGQTAAAKPHPDNILYQGHRPGGAISVSGRSPPTLSLNPGPPVPDAVRRGRMSWQPCRDYSSPRRRRFSPCRPLSVQLSRNNEVGAWHGGV